MSILNNWKNMFKPKILALSYPRSGATFLRYFARTIMNEPLMPNNAEELHMDNTTYCRCHFPLVDPPMNFPIDLLMGVVLIIRDYKECFLRQKLFHDSLEWGKKIYFEKEMTLYNPPHQCCVYANIYFYDTIDKPKILIYYEDLMTNPKHELQRLADFLKADCGEFLSNLDYHKKESLKFYETYQTNSITKGKDIKYHQKNISQENIKYMDDFASQCEPQLYDKYLKRYHYE